MLLRLLLPIWLVLRIAIARLILVLHACAATVFYRGSVGAVAGTVIAIWIGVLREGVGVLLRQQGILLAAKEAAEEAAAGLGLFLGVVLCIGTLLDLAVLGLVLFLGGETLLALVVAAEAELGEGGEDEEEAVGIKLVSSRGVKTGKEGSAYTRIMAMARQAVCSLHAVRKPGSLTKSLPPSPSTASPSLPDPNTVLTWPVHCEAPPLLATVT